MATNSTDLPNSLVKANALYRSGNYREALSIYEQVALRPGWAQLVRVNVAICRKRLGLPIKLSVIVPVFNTGKYLDQCLWSILNQTEVSLEVIVINDGSSDNSLDIIQQYMRKDKRIVLINNTTPSGNPGTPRNQGIAIARGEYLGFVDSDDWIEPDYFARLLEAIEPSKLDMVFAWGYTKHFNGKISTVPYNSKYINATDSELFRYHESFMVWDKLYRTRLIKEHSIALGETRAAVDVPFIFKAYYLMKKVGVAATKGYHYRRESESSVTVNFRKSSNCDFEIEAYRDVENWCRDNGVSEQYTNIVKYRKVASYTYTLSLISPGEFHAFFAKIKPELQAIDSDLIARISGTVKKPLVFEQFKAITTGDANAYSKTYRNAPSVASPEPSEPSIDKGEKSIAKLAPAALPPLTTKGAKKGVLFFPNWSKSNPYQKLFYASLAQNFDIKAKGYRPEQFLKELLDENQNEFSYVHLHWLHSLMDVTRDDGADKLLANLQHAKSLGYKIIYTAHNILSHDSINQERELTFRRKIAKYFDHVLVHGELAKSRVIDEIGVESGKIHVMPHGTYQGYYPNHVTRSAARRKLGIGENKFVFLFFGNIRGYKGIDALLDAYEKIRAKRDDVVLVIAGRVFEAENEAKIKHHAKAEPSILFTPGYIADGDVQYYFNAADLMVMPYMRILTSGAALLGISFERPIIAPRLGLIPELIEDGKQGYLFDSHDDMLSLMERAVTQWHDDAPAWADTFNFSDVNARLRWSLLTAHPAFSRIFSADTPEQKIPSSSPMDVGIGAKEVWELEVFAEHCQTRKPERVLVIEPTQSHQETLPSLIYYFNTLGIGVDILLRSEQRKYRQIFPSLKHSAISDAIFFYVLDEKTIERAADLINKNPYEYLFFNTVYEYWLNDGMDRIFSLVTRVSKRAFITIHHYGKYKKSSFSHPLVSQNNAFVLGEYLSVSYGIDLLLPAYFYQDVGEPDFDGKLQFTCVGGFDPTRRDYQMLLDACIALNSEGYRDKYVVRLLGPPYGGNQPHIDFLQAIKKNTLSDTIYCDKHCTFEHIFETLRQTHFQLFLINSEKEGALEYFDNQITGGMNLSLAFSTIPVIDKSYAARWRFDDFSVTHEGSGGFIDAMRGILANPTQYAPFRSRIEAKCAHLTQLSLNNLRRKL